MMATFEPGGTNFPINSPAREPLVQGSTQTIDERLLPGASVELQMETDTRHTSVRGRILRCAVVRVRPTWVCYRGAIGFDRHLLWFVDEAGAPSGTKVRLAHPGRADATPQVI